MTDTELRARVMEHWEKAKELYPENRIVCLCLQGSQNYYLDDEESDVDTKLLLVPTHNEIILNKKPISTTHILENGEHIDAKDIRLYWQCFKKGNPNFVEILFSRVSYVNPMYADYFRLIQIHAEDIARVNPLASAKAMYGMCMEKFHALEHRYPSRVEIIDKFGYDPKQLQHLIRMTVFLERYLDNEWAYADILNLGYFIKDKYDYRDYMMRVKRGKEYNLYFARTMAEYYKIRAEKALERAKEELLAGDNPEVAAFMDYVLGLIIKTAIKEELK